MFPFGSVVPPQQSAGAPPQAHQQNQQPRQLMSHPEAVKKMLMSNVSSAGPPQQLKHMEILSRPETQVLIQSKVKTNTIAIFISLRIILFLLLFFIGLNNGELSQGFLLQQLNNPNVNQRDREMLFTVLGHFNATPSAAENKPHPVLPNNVRDSYNTYRDCLNKLNKLILISDANAECKFATTKYASTE